MRRLAPGILARWKSARRASFLAGVATGALLAASLFQSVQAQTHPLTRKDNVSEVLHGVEITDPYRWLEDQSSINGDPAIGSPLVGRRIQTAVARELAGFVWAILKAVPQN